MLVLEATTADEIDAQFARLNQEPADAMLVATSPLFVTRARQIAALAAQAQQRAMPVIGYLSPRTTDSDALMLGSVRSGLGDVGYVEGRNVVIEYRFANGRYARACPPNWPI